VKILASTRLDNCKKNNESPDSPDTEGVADAGDDLVVHPQVQPVGAPQGAWMRALDNIPPLGGGGQFTDVHPQMQPVGTPQGWPVRAFNYIPPGGGQSTGVHSQV